MSWNVNGWTQNNQDLRVRVINHLNPDIVCLSETHLDGKNTIELEGYKFFDHNRQAKHRDAPYTHGGVGILVKNQMCQDYVISVVDQSFDGILAIKFSHRISTYSFVVFSCYLPPENSLWCDATNFYGHLISLIYSYEDSDALYVCGDFNGRIGNEKDYVEDMDELPPRQVVDDVKNKLGDVLLEFLTDLKFCVLNGRVGQEGNSNKFTCIRGRGKSVVDYVLVPQSGIDKCNDFAVHTPSELIDMLDLQSSISTHCKPSDHSVLVLKFSTTIFIPDRDTENVSDVSSAHSNAKRVNWSRVPSDFQNNSIWQAAVNEIIDNIRTMENNQSSIDKVYGELCTMIYEETNRVGVQCETRLKKKFKYHKPYWDDDLTKAWKFMHSCEKDYLRCHRRQNDYLSIQDKFRHAQRCFDKLLCRKERLYNKEKVETIEQMHFSNPREFWRQMKQLGPRPKQGIPMQVYDGDVLTDNTDKVLHTWCHDFSELYNESSTDNGNDSDIVHDINRLENEMMSEYFENNEYLNRDISYDEVERVVNRLKANKAPGVDKLPNEVLKNNDMILVLWNLINKCFIYCKVPTVWLKAVICPIPKGGSRDRHVPLNYRGISLLPTIAKVFSGVLNNRLDSYNEQMNMYAEEQNGFRRKRSCLDHAFTLTTVLRNRIKNRESTFVAFVDMEKAFDWVNRDMLMYKLLSYNVDGRFYLAVKALYTGTLSCVKLNELYSPWFETYSGVRQGDCLSPTMFNLFINDLVQNVNALSCGVQLGANMISLLLYADDIALIAPDEEKLQCMINCLLEYCTKWKLKVSHSKTNVVHFRPKRKRVSNYEFKYGDRNIDIVSSYRYLGMCLDEHLDFKKGVTMLSQSAGRALGGIVSKFKTLRNVGYETFTKLYETGVVPIADYFSELWYMNDVSNINKIQQRAYRYYLGLHPKTPIAAMQGDMGWMLPRYRMYLKACRLWNRLCDMDNSRLTKRVLIWDKENGGYGWIDSFVKMMKDIDIDVDVDNFTPVNTDAVKANCVSHQSSKWKKEIVSKPKLRTYITFKEDFIPEWYVKAPMSKKNRSLIAQIRMGILPLRIETGRWEKGGIPVTDRICLLCKNGVEDEYHFICLCPMYVNQRNTLFKKVCERTQGFCELQLRDQFIHLLKYHQSLLSAYVRESFEARKAFMLSN